MEFESLISPGANMLMNIARAGLLLLAGWMLAHLMSRLARRLGENYISPHQKVLLSKAVFWLVIILFLVSAVHQMGFKIGVLLGTAGILSLAIGFAAQTSASNLISGLFVLSEESFKIGDVITVGQTTGEVLSIDLLSVKLRTYDNIFVRIPNETIIKSEVRTVTKFPVRRFDLIVGIAYRSDIEHARKVLLNVAKDNPLCLDEPAPVVILQGFNASSIDVMLAIWSTRENFLALRNSMQEQVKAAFDAEGIEIPFPHMTFYTGADCEPLPIRLTGGDLSAAPLTGGDKS
jgi:small-conductance mechanosensitive channel